MRARKLAVFAATIAIAVAAPSARSARGLRQLKLAQQHLSAVLTVQRWAELAYDLRPAPAHPCEESSSTVTNPDGSLTTTFVNADCSQAVVTQRPDSPDFTTVRRTPDGLEERIEAQAGDFLTVEGIQYPQRFDFRHELSTGDTARYAQRFELEEDPIVHFVFITGTTTEGEMVLANGERVRFGLAQPRPPEEFQYTDVLDMILPNRERLHWEIPTNVEEQIDFERPAPGTYRSGNQVLHFAVTGAEGQFKQWMLDDARGLQGLFALNPDFSGRGRALRGRRLQFVGAWDRKARGTVLLANGQAAVAGPSAGAQDFGSTRFRALGLANAPTPGL